MAPDFQPESPFAVANYFIDKAAATGVELTPMKLLKLAYIAHGWSLGLLGRPLISEVPQAWKYGPVIESLYQSFKRYGNGQIPPSAKASHAIMRDRDLVPRLLEHVWSGYAHLTGGQLSTLTHQSDTPWYEVWHRRGGSTAMGAPIPDDLIQGHYKLKASAARKKAAHVPAAA